MGERLGTSEEPPPAQSLEEGSIIKESQRAYLFVAAHAWGMGLARIFNARVFLAFCAKRRFTVAVGLVQQLLVFAFVFTALAAEFCVASSELIWLGDNEFFRERAGWA